MNLTLDDPIVFFNNIKKNKISLEEAKNIQQEYKKNLDTIRKGNKNAKQKKPLQILTFILMQEIMRTNFLKIMVQ